MKRLKKALFSLFALPTILTACAGAPLSPWETPSENPAVREKTLQASGTRFIIRLWLDPKDARPPETLFKPAVAEIFRISRLTDAENPKSEIFHVNEMAATEPIPVSADLAFLFNISQKLYTRSGGAFDITFAPIQDQVESYGTDAGLDGSDREFTPSGVDKNTRLRIGSRNWLWDPVKRTVRFARPGVKLVVKGIARGFAAQKAAEKLLMLKVRGFAVIAGNSFVASGAALKDPQIMCIEDFDHPGRCQYRVTALHPEKIFALGMAASTDRPGHNYNPKSGSRTYHAGGAAVSGPDGAWAQGAATVASILEESKFQEFFKNSEQPKISGVWAGESSSSPPQGDLEPYARISPLSR